MKKSEFGSIDQLSVDTIRLLAVDMVQNANSGHPGLPLGAAPMAYVLFQRFLRFNPGNPGWIDRDRFILSAGHGSALLYSLLHLFGYDLEAAELEQFRKLGSRTPGHPESTVTPGIEVTTGPLGQGFANGVGTAIAERFLASRYNTGEQKIIDHFTYAIVSDGDLMEGLASEAASLAGHLRLGKLIYLYDDNGISLDGETGLSFTEDVPARFRAYGWHTLSVENGNDLQAVERAIADARNETERPSLISVKTLIGYGSPLQGTNKAHGTPLGATNLRDTKAFLGWDPDKTFYVPEEVKAHLAGSHDQGELLESQWNNKLGAMKLSSPKLASELLAGFDQRMPDGWEQQLPVFSNDNEISTRDASGEVLMALKRVFPWLVGGSADLASSNVTPGEVSESFQWNSYDKSNIWFGVREHAMGAIMNGMAAHGGVKAYGATFLAFSDYLRGAIRLAALGRHPVTYIFTHDSIALGEDGPTHQPVEQITALRTVPNLVVLRPADANEVLAAWKFAMGHVSGPVALILSRQKLPVLDQQKYGPAGGLARGGYILSDSKGDPEIIFIATGSEVKLALGAQEMLWKEGVDSRVVSLPSFELFDLQPQEYRDIVLPPDQQKRISIEAGVSMPWYRYVGSKGEVIAIDRFGESGGGDILMECFGFTVANVFSRAKHLLKS